jgi:hypothetical protein
VPRLLDARRVGCSGWGAREAGHGGATHDGGLHGRRRSLATRSAPAAMRGGGGSGEGLADMLASTRWAVARARCRAGAR